MNYSQDKEFLASHGFSVLELVRGDARVLICPAMQGRVMTTTASGIGGTSYGWINTKFIEKGIASSQFNPYGGEERLWLGPEGGPFSWYFAPGAEQVYPNWKVPAFIDTEGFETVEADSCRASFTRTFRASNASGHIFDIRLDRSVVLLDRDDAEKALGRAIPVSEKFICYKTVNTITNVGSSAWTKTTGMPSIWLLSSLTPTPTTMVNIPYDPGFSGRIVKDDYFGKIPADRLSVSDGMVHFRIDGAFRSKIGLPAGSATDRCTSYDSARGIFTLLVFDKPSGSPVYVNSQWGEQDDPWNGDVINSYNDGPNETGSVMGPFYEIETSSPAAALAPGESLTHTQLTLHIEEGR